MKHGYKPAKPRMEDVLASIRRAIDENTHGQAPERLGGSMAELRVKLDQPANQDDRSRRSYDHVPSAGASPQQGFAGILGGRKTYGEVSPSRETLRTRDPVQRQLEASIPEGDQEGQYPYDGYYGAQLEEYVEPETYPAAEPESPGRYLPLSPPAIADRRPSFSQNAGLMSEASSEATKAAFNHLAETLTRRALGERPIGDVAQELLRSMLKQWLDDNLPKIVERLVREEIERVVRRPQR
jgi:cell pole-organizing protein PopZ